MVAGCFNATMAQSNHIRKLARQYVLCLKFKRFSSFPKAFAPERMQPAIRYATICSFTLSRFRSFCWWKIERVKERYFRR